jgi:hypothetical protein
VIYMLMSSNLYFELWKTHVAHGVWRMACIMIPDPASVCSAGKDGTSGAGGFIGIEHIRLRSLSDEILYFDISRGLHKYLRDIARIRIGSVQHDVLECDPR